jgi:hypothetical protein
MLLALSVACRKPDRPPAPEAGATGTDAPATADPSADAASTTADAAAPPHDPPPPVVEPVSPAEAPADPQAELETRTYDVLVDGTIGYRGTTRGVVVEDLADPAKPVRLAAVDLPASVNGLARFDARGPRLAAACGAEGVFLIDVASPAKPEIAGRFDTPGGAWRMAVDLPRLYVADGTGGVLVLDVSNPAAPRKAGAWYRPGVYVRDVAFANGSLYVAAGTAGVILLDLSDPSRPVETASVDTPGDARALEVGANLVHVADGPGGYRIIEFPLSGPDPEVGEVGELATPDICRDVVLAGEAAFLAVGDRGVIAVDVAEATAPRVLGRHEARRSVNRVTIGNSDLLYVANDAGGLLVLAAGDPAAMSVIFPAE